MIFDYQKALLLYEKYGKSKVMLAMFRACETAFNTAKLKEFLQELEKQQDLSDTFQKDLSATEKVADKLVEMTEKVADKLAAQLVEDKFSYELKKYAASPNELLRKLAAALQTNYREKDRLFAQLRLFATDEERKVAALRILELATAIKKQWEDLQFFEVHGKLPTPLAPVPVSAFAGDVAYLLNRKKTLVANISRDKKRGQVEKVLLWEKELAEVLSFLQSC